MKIFRRIILFILIVCIIIVSYFLVDGYILYKESITEKSLEDRISEIRSNESFTSISEVPSYYKDAVVSIEDHRFYSHFGVDIIATSRAMLDNILSFKMKGGGSSITQQVAKNLCFTQEKTLTRKVAELFVVFELEKTYEKDEILEIYINNMYFGHGYYNIHDAAYGYYEKAPADLDLYQATLLAGVPNAPSAYAPTVNMKLAEERQRQVLDAMVKYNTLSIEDADKIKDMQVTK
ncbi:MAG: transglycosylase domain-containing protein [Clostridia bacterium]|nr:transglycosylase domain-containing protein [Clostridia bacterium]